MATASTVALLERPRAAAILTSKGWPAVRETFFSWESFRTSFPDVLRGFWLDVKLFVVVEIVVLALGLVVALCRTSSAPALAPAAAARRGLRRRAARRADHPRGLPRGLRRARAELSGLPTDPLVLGGIALALSYGAYVAEVYRAGIDSVHPSQRAAALAVGLTGRQAIAAVVLPQAVRRVVPPLLNDFISLQKDVASSPSSGRWRPSRVAQIEGVDELHVHPLVAAAVLYLCVTVPLARWLDHLQRRRRP